jgi:protein tyrosine/serine phosphatase
MRILLCCSFLAAIVFPNAGPSAQSSAANSHPVIERAYGQRLQLPGVPNGGKISDSLFRGAQPHAEGLQQLKHLGVTTIVDLRGEDRNKVEWERQQSEALGMHFVNIAVSGWQPPTNQQIAQFLSLLRDHPQEKVFVHCRFGDDRTGVFVAAFRMAFEGWQPQQAINEMYFFGFNGMWHPAMKSYVRDFPALLNSAPALSEFRPQQERKAPGSNGAENAAP